MGRLFRGGLFFLLHESTHERGSTLQSSSYYRPLLCQSLRTSISIAAPRLHLLKSVTVETVETGFISSLWRREVPWSL
ncbi:hypothetical protein NDU88_010590 [Pleurodeles waltl]|uniref:Secreted protein n=1 Tax=Pleurodeles waltl TaxID=8319 RepID=A0AAV7R0Z9_PLEWA|nr:hypothetical protein NDU88_010590 [Pleurodeles waltl]